MVVAETPQLFDKNVSLNQVGILKILDFDEKSELFLMEGNLKDSIRFANISWARIPDDLRKAIPKPSEALASREALIPSRKKIVDTEEYHRAKETFGPDDDGYGYLFEDECYYRKAKYLIQISQWEEILEAYHEKMVEVLIDAGLYISTQRTHKNTANLTLEEQAPLVKLAPEISR